MIAIDTNILVRLVAADDTDQLRVAEDLLAANVLRVSFLALVETEWVLRSVYRYPAPRIADAMLALLHLPNIRIDAEDQVIWAIDRFRSGADLADMLLIVDARDATAFASFDRKLKRQAGSQVPVAVMRLTAKKLV